MFHTSPPPKLRDTVEIWPGSSECQVLGRGTWFLGNKGLPLLQRKRKGATNCNCKTSGCCSFPFGMVLDCPKPACVVFGRGLLPCRPVFLASLRGFERYAFALFQDCSQVSPTPCLSVFGQIGFRAVPFGCGSRLNRRGYALCFHLPGFHFGYRFFEPQPLVCWVFSGEG